MIRIPLAPLAGLALSSLLVFACGGSPAQPNPTPTLAPTPTPEPTPVPSPFSSIAPCSLPASNPAAPDCQEPDPQMRDDVNIAIDSVIAQRPDLFDLNDVQGGPKIRDLDKYMTAVVSALNQAGLCGHVNPEGEIGVKRSNSFSEQWIIASHAGWAVPIGNWVKRKYVGACMPATF